jgi:hypothetical protein
MRGINGGELRDRRNAGGLAVPGPIRGSGTDRDATGRSGCRITQRPVDCGHRPGSPGRVRETELGLFNGRDRRHVAVVITTDGRRVQMPLNDAGLQDGSILSLLRSLLLGLDGLLGLLITGSRRENGGTRRIGR